MGYTHYFPQMRDFTADEWAAISVAARQIIAASGVPLAFEYTEPLIPPQINAEYIRFNGIGDGGHETFIVNRTLAALASRWDYYAEQLKNEGRIFVFCKTAHKPYDIVVTAVLSAINRLAPGALDIGSDGGPYEWKSGVALANRALQTRDISVPSEVAG